LGPPGRLDNGRQAADGARRSRPGLKVLFITGFSQNAVLSHGHRNAGMHLMTKPFAMEALASRIGDLVDPPA
jgi:DNA-binding response OmpR family regulator